MRAFLGEHVGPPAARQLERGVSRTRPRSRSRACPCKGVEAVDEAQLRAALQTKAGSWIPFTKKPAFDTDEFQRDLQRLRNFYTERGYPDARVTDVDVVFDEKKEHVRLTVTVREGEPTLRRVDALRGLRGAARAAPGRRCARGSAWRRATCAIAAASTRRAPPPSTCCRSSAIPTPRSPSTSSRARRRGAWRIVVRATPGQAATFGPIEVRGNASVGEDVIRRQLAFKPGERYSAGRVRASQSRLSSLDLFRFAYVEPRGAGRRSRPAVPMRVTVAEDKHRQFTGAVGYGTEEKARVRGEWKHVNFFGGARSGGRREQVVVARSRCPPELQRALVLHPPSRRSRRRRRPGTSGSRSIASPPTAAGPASSWRRERRNPVTGRGATTSVGLSFINEFTDYRVSDEALADPSLRNSADQPRSRSRDGGRHRHAGRRCGCRPITTPPRAASIRSAASPSRARVEQAGKFLPGRLHLHRGQRRGAGLLLDACAAERRATGRRGIVFAGALRGSTIDAPAPTDAAVPFFKRYFLGGSTSLRGWGRYEVSPLTESGQPIGGLTCVETSAEVRVPFGTKLSAVAFVDAGSVGRNPWRLDPGGFRAAVGPGVRYDTPIGPVRLDLGYQLNPIAGLLVKGKPEARRWRAHISIGQAF